MAEELVFWTKIALGGLGGLVFYSFAALCLDCWVYARSGVDTGFRVPDLLTVLVFCGLVSAAAWWYTPPVVEAGLLNGAAVGSLVMGLTGIRWCFDQRIPAERRWRAGAGLVIGLTVTLLLAAVWLAAWRSGWLGWRYANLRGTPVAHRAFAARHGNSRYAPAALGRAAEMGRQRVRLWQAVAERLARENAAPLTRHILEGLAGAPPPAIGFTRRFVNRSSQDMSPVEETLAVLDRKVRGAVAVLGGTTMEEAAGHPPFARTTVMLELEAFDHGSYVWETVKALGPQPGVAMKLWIGVYRAGQKTPVYGTEVTSMPHARYETRRMSVRDVTISSGHQTLREALDRELGLDRARRLMAEPGAP